ncbi:hypothetical protein BH11PAT1_BH11PAT1_5440 [soil metagenome]
MYKKLVIILFANILLLFFAKDVNAYENCNSLVCSGGSLDGQQVTNWCQFVGTPYNSAYDCDPNPPYGYQLCYWDPAACDSADCRDYDSNYCVGKVSCPAGVPDACVNPQCSQTGQCYSACAVGPWCVAPPTPTSTPPPGVTPPPPVVTPPPNLTCDQQFPGDAGKSWVGCGECHDWDPAWKPGATGSCTDKGSGCCFGVPPSTGGSCQVGKSCSSCGPGGAGNCSDCNGGWCNGGSCSSCSGGTTGDTCSSNFSCNGFTAFNRTKNPTPTSFTRGIGRGTTYSPVGFGNNNTLTIDPGNTVWFSTFKGGVESTIPGTIMGSSTKPIVRTQFITRNASIPSSNTNTNDVIGSCLMVAGPFRVNWCQGGISKIGWDNRNNSSWPYGSWPYSGYASEPSVYNFNTPEIVSRPNFNVSTVISGNRERYVGACDIDGDVACCAKSQIGTDPDGTKVFQCTNPNEDDTGGCGEGDLRRFEPNECKVNDLGTLKDPFTMARGRTMRKQFTTPGTYYVEASEQFACGIGVNDNDRNPCAIQVVVKSPGYTISGTMVNDNNGNAGTDPGEDGYTGNIILSLSPPVAGVVPNIDRLGNYKFTNVPNGAYRIIVDQSSIDANRYISSDVSAMNVPVHGADQRGQQIFISRYYQITGKVCDDQNKDRKCGAGDPPYTKGTVTLSGIPSVNVDGSGNYLFNLTKIVKPNVAYTITYNDTTIAPPYILEIPNTYAGISVGPPCAIPSSASCEAVSWVTPQVIGDITNLNFAVTSSTPWVQFQGLDVRQDSGFTMAVPETVSLSCQDKSVTPPTDRGYSSVGKY